jgi:ATP/maltotriose-dependent transcriptional regulator MalT
LSGDAPRGQAGGRPPAVGLERLSYKGEDVADFMGKLKAQFSSLNSQQKASLDKANELISHAKYEDADKAFSELALELENTNQANLAANIHERAANAFTNAGIEQEALSHARSALNLLNKNQMNDQAKKFYINIILSMTYKKMESAIRTLNQEFGFANNIVISPKNNQTPKKHVSFPTNCPKCGAPINIANIHWLDSNTVECSHCGISIQGQENK